MISLFLEHYDINYPITYLPRINSIVSNYITTLDRLKSYYFLKKESLSRPNLLLNYLSLLPIDLEEAPYDLAMKLNTVAIYLAKQIGIVSKYNTGKIVEDTIIPDCTEIFLYAPNNKIIYTENQDYLKLTPIRCIYTTIDVPFITHPQNFKGCYPGSDTTIYEIDGVALGMQYYYWAKEQLELELGIDPAKYMYMIALTNTIDNLLDHTLFNRFLTFETEDKLPSFINYNPISIRNDIDKLDTAFKRLDVFFNKTKNIPYEQFLLNIPGISNKTSYEYLQINHRHYTAHSEWVIWLARLRYIYLIIKLLGKEGYRRNRDLINAYRIDIKYFKQTNKLNTVDDISVKHYIETYMEKIESLIKDLK